MPANMKMFYYILFPNCKVTECIEQLVPLSR
jgi:hypothetical protein